MAVIQPKIFRINSTATQSQVGDVVVKPQTKNSTFYSSKVLNYVESSEVSGYLKTVLYTEVNTNVNVGDRIFILNGNYDSNVFIEQDKYRKYSDGYRVLNVDGCKITLDIDYTGELPYKNSKTGDFIFVHHIKTQEEFDYINSIKIWIDNDLKSTFSGNVDSNDGTYVKLDAQSIIYAPNKFNGIQNAGFWVRSNAGWVDVTDQVFYGKIKQNTEFSTSGNLYIVGDDFTFRDVTFNQRTSYKYENYSWVIDIKYKTPYLSKTNFRFGKFDGTHNDGIFGTYLKKAFWNGSIWNSGSFVYSNWNSGVMDSKHTTEEVSYLSKIKDNVVVQTIDFSNNKGFGYNFIEDSLFGMSTINNGNFLNCNFLTSSSTFSAIDNYFGLTMSTFNNLNGGKIELCDVYNIKSNDVYFLNSAIYNSNLNKSKIVNSEVIDSALNNGFWSNEGGIKVIGADMWSYVENGDKYGTIKLYISEEDYFKLNKGDAFYISKINKDYILSSLDDNQKILFPLESRYLLQNFNDYEISGKKSTISVSLKSSLENKYKYYVESRFDGERDVEENIAIQSNISSPSIDISSELFGWYKEKNKTILTTKNKISPITPENINELFINTILGNGDFKSGIMSNSTWLSGDNSNYYANILSKNTVTNNFDISKSVNNLTIKMKNNSYLGAKTIEGYDIKEGDYLWIKSINYNLNGTIISIDGRYKVLRVIISGSGVNTTLTITIASSDNNTIISGLSTGATYSTPSAQTNNYLSIHKFYMTDSKIISGKFRRTGLNNCVFQNQFFKKYENSGNAIANTELIRLVNIMFNRTKNQVKSGVVYKSHFVDDIFNGATFYNSIWLGGTFSDGLFKSSVWTGGNFNRGRFIDSRKSNILSDFDTKKNNVFWQGGNFNGGEFFNSVWIGGTFNNGRFYKSDWYGGIWNNGILGSKNLTTMDTTFAYYGPTSSGATFTIWNNGLVENAMVGGYGALDWYNGKMIGGEFTSNNTTTNVHSTWHDGEFYGSSFTNKAWWKNGNFLGGKFLSNIGWDKASFLTHSKSITDYGWVNGKFYGGEFGNGSTATNSIWYDGVMSGGVFQGRFWKDGIFSNGKFYGSFITQSDDISLSLLPFTYSFYGLWNDGKVTSLVSQAKTDEITSTRREVQSTNLSLGKILRKKLDIADMYGVLWKNGTFSNDLGSFNDSVWIDGEFNLGNFNNSYFNPFVDLSLSGIPLNYYRRSSYLKKVYDDVIAVINTGNNQSPSFLFQNIENVISDFNNNQIDSNFICRYDSSGSLYSGDEYFSLIDESYYTFKEMEDSGYFISDPSTTFLKIFDRDVIKLIPNDYIGILLNYDTSNTAKPILTTNVFPNQNGINIPYNFTTYSTCVWTGGNFNSGEFNYSKWTGGNFNDGTMNGAIWLDGTFNYGFMNNSYWEKGTWRNGNWNGAPFDYTHLGLSGSKWIILDKRAKDLLNNINDYAQFGDYRIHLSNVITKKSVTPIPPPIHSFSTGNGFLSWTFSTKE
jgi:hypothetical protein